MIQMLMICLFQILNASQTLSTTLSQAYICCAKCSDITYSYTTRTSIQFQSRKQNVCSDKSKRKRKKIMRVYKRYDGKTCKFMWKNCVLLIVPVQTNVILHLAMTWVHLDMLIFLECVHFYQQTNKWKSTNSK